MDNKNDKLYGMGSDTRLLHYLRSKNGDRFTKIDAFCDLIDRMTEQSKGRKGINETTPSPLQYGQFTGSISELAKDWHWHRATVRTFLDGLESQGFLTRQLDGRNYIFRLRTSTGVTVPVDNSETLLAIGYFLLHHWDEFNLSADVLAKYFEEYETLSVDSYQGNDLARELAEMKTRVITEAFCHLDVLLSDSEKFAALKTERITDGIVQLVGETFNSPKPWSWLKWMQALQWLDLALLDKSDNASKVSLLQGNDLPADFTKQDMATLKQLHQLLYPSDTSSSDASSKLNSDE